MAGRSRVDGGRSLLLRGAARAAHGPGEGHHVGQIGRPKPLAFSARRNLDDAAPSPMAAPMFALCTVPTSPRSAASSRSSSPSKLRDRLIFSHKKVRSTEVASNVSLPTCARAWKLVRCHRRCLLIARVAAPAVWPYPSGRITKRGDAIERNSVATQIARDHVVRGATAFSRPPLWMSHSTRSSLVA